MIGILIATHGKMAYGLLDACNLILGEVENINYISLNEGDDLDEYRERYKRKVKELDQGKGVMVLVDIQNATPFNIAGSIMKELFEEGINIRVVTGVNLPMVLESNFIRSNYSNVDELYSEVLRIGAESIVELRESVGI